MKVLQFTAPVSKRDVVVIDEDILPYFYNYLHRHKELQLTLIIKGEGTLMAGNYTQAFKPGDIYILGANQPHIFKSGITYFSNPKIGNAHAIHIFFDQERFSDDFLNLEEMESIKKFLVITINGLQLTNQHCDYSEGVIKNLRHQSNFDRLLSFLKLLQYFAKEVKDWKLLSTGFSNYSLSDSEGTRMNDIYQYTLEHYAENISLSRIASVAHITPHAFCKYFKKHTRKTYNAFLNEVRINEACKKIMEGNHDGISPIAYSTGFNSAINFNKVFKKTTGMSPTDYIKEFKRKAC